MRKTKMHRTIIAAANDLGYFPTLEQADAVWNRLNVDLAQRVAADPKNRPKSEELDAAMRRAIDAVLGNRKGERA